METSEETTNVDDFFAHYGVKGMRWGVRRNRSRSTVSEPSEDFSKSRNLKSKKSSELSNQELKFLNERLQLEKNYKSLTREQTKISKGRKFATEVVAVGGTATALYNLSTSPMGKAARQAIEAKLRA